MISLYRNFVLAICLGISATCLALFLWGCTVSEVSGAPSPLPRRVKPSNVHPGWICGQYQMRWHSEVYTWDLDIHASGDIVLYAHGSSSIWYGLWDFDGGRLRFREWPSRERMTEEKAEPVFTYHLRYLGTHWETEDGKIGIIRNGKITD